MKVEYYINDCFCLDDGVLAGVNVMLYGGKYDRDYFFEEKRCETKKEAEIFVSDYDAEMIKRPEEDMNHPFLNRYYTEKEIRRYIAIKHPLFSPFEVKRYISQFHITLGG